MKMRLASLILCLVLVITALASCTAGGSDIRSEADLKNKKIGVIEGSKSDAFAQSYAQNGCEIIGYDSRLNILDAFEAGEIDCAIFDENHAEAFAKENDAFEVLDGRLGEETFAFSMLASKKVYTIMLNKALAALREEGTLDKIVSGYLSDSEYVYDFAEELDNSNGTFNIALDSSLYPYVYPADESHPAPRGMALAIIDAVCEHLGCDYTLLTPTTSSLPSSLIMGVADFAIGSYILPTAEGMEIVETDPILTYQHAIVVKK